jgi:flagellar biosynthesis/type III secretory pathway protein FliH
VTNRAIKIIEGRKEGTEIGREEGKKEGRKEGTIICCSIEYGRFYVIHRDFDVKLVNSLFTSLHSI